MTNKTPDYITTKETAEAWGVTRRYVNMCIEDGRIPGAVRMGNMWLVPKGADKPVGSRREKLPQYSLDADLLDMIAATLVPMPEDNPDAILDTFDEDRLRLHYESELAYLRGDFQRVMQCYARTVNDEAARLRACSVTIAAAISLGDYDAYTAIEAWLKERITEGKGGVSASIADLALTIAAVSAIAPNMTPEWLKSGDFSAIPMPARPDAAYKQAKYLLCIGRNEAALSVAQTALSFCEAKHGIAYAGIYLRIVCAFSNYALERLEEAKRFLIDAMKIALPYGFVTPFAEMVSAFGGIMEQLLEQEYPACYDAVIGQWARVTKNWLIFHNRFTADNITLILTLRDYEIAKLAAQGLTDTQIGIQVHLAAGTVKNRVDTICQMLFLSGRNRKKDLTEYIL